MSRKQNTHFMINIKIKDFWKWVVEIIDPPRKRIKVRDNDTKLATDHHSFKDIQIIIEHNAWNN